MRRLGETVRETRGTVVVSCDDAPELDDAVYDSSLDRVGKVVDIFGPVERPYAVVEKSRKPSGPKLYLRN